AVCFIRVISLLMLSYLIVFLILCRVCIFFVFFFFNATATPEIYTLSLHDALPIWRRSRSWSRWGSSTPTASRDCARCWCRQRARSEEHTSELQSLRHLVCRLLLEKKKKKKHDNEIFT